jgi:mannose-6-phosphate isomerase-like protein (cupin superfamily)
MPVFRGLSPTSRPEWSSVTSAGIFRVPREGRFDRHYHDCDEYWLVYKGRAKVFSEGEEFIVGPGDILCTRAGDEHDVLEVYEDLEAFWFEGTLQGQARVGHLHRSAELAKGHVVPGAEPPASR